MARPTSAAARVLILPSLGAEPLLLTLGFLILALAG